LIYARLEVELRVNSLFEAPTVAELAIIVESKQQQQHFSKTEPIARIDRNQPIPLSFCQEQLWFISQLHPNVPVYNESLTIYLSGGINSSALEQSLTEMIRRHEILRTTFDVVDGKPVQVIHSPSEFTLPIVDLRSHRETERETQALHLATQQLVQPMDLTSRELLQATLILVSDADSRLYIAVHHILIDGVSLTNIFLPELETLYKTFSQGKPNLLPELTIQYADYAAWQRQRFSNEVFSTHLAYWKKKLDNFTPLQLPIQKKLTPQATFKGSRQYLDLSENLTQKLKLLSRIEGVTLFITLAAAINTLLYRYSAQEDICIGTVMAERDRPEVQGIIGEFLNTLVLRTDLKGNPSFRDLLKRVRQVILEAKAHRDLPFEKLVAALKPDRQGSQNPLFSVAFVLQPTLPEEKLGWTVSQQEVYSQTSKFDLTFSLSERQSSIIGYIEYSTELFDTATINRTHKHLITLLEGIVTDPDQYIAQLPLLTEAERHQLLVEWNNTTTEYPQDKCIHQLFEEQAKQQPDAIALVFENQQLTYGELNRRSNQLAHYLQSLGVGSDMLVGICVERSLEMVVGLLGILKAGGAYLPLDPNYPQERLSFMLEDAQVPVLLTQQKLLEKLPQHQAHLVYLDKDAQEFAQVNEISVTSDVKSSNLAYVLYTSGSTGRPKAVAIEHHSPVALVSWAQEIFTPEQLAGVLASTSICFDLSVFELFVTLSVGGKVILAENALHLPTISSADQVTLINTVPSAIAHLIQKNNLPQQVCTVNLAGEPLQNQLVQQIYQHSQVERVFNLYGPSEDTTYSTFSLIEKGTNNSPPIGRPISNTQIYILNSNLQPVPVGVPGQLYIGGAGLARGYLKRPDLTKEKFIPNPFSNKPDERLYKTGDLAKYLPDGNIEYLGRIDNQVKIRGFRIELGEIEAVLAQHPDVRQAVVICREDIPGNKRLVAYIVSNLIPERVPYQSECQLEIDNNIMKLHTEDISSGGVGLLGMPEITEGKCVRLHLLLPGESEHCWLSGTVAWSRPLHTGIQFDLTPTQQAQVEQSVVYLLSNQGLWKVLQRTVSGNLPNYLKQRLPDYMVPSTFVLMKALPLTPNRKVDRRALPAPDSSLWEPEEDKFVAPTTPTEVKLAAIWAEVLGLQKVSVNDNFFELGGHSLLAIQIISRIREAFSIEIPLHHLFEAPTIASLARVIETTQSTELEKQHNSGITVDILPSLLPKTRDRHIPLSIAQQDIWHFQELYPKSSASNSPIALRFTGEFSPQVLELSINEIVRRHEILRTTFSIREGQPVQVIAPSLTLPLRIIDLQDIPLAKQEAEAKRISTKETQHCFDLTNEPLIRTTLLRLDPSEHLLLITMHHIITDGWSHGIFLHELGTLYNAFLNGFSTSTPLPELSAQYADFTLWERECLNEKVLEKQLSYWLHKLADIPLPLNLLPSLQPQQINNSKRTSLYSIVLPESLVASIKAISRYQGVTTFVIILTALKILLFKWSEQSDIIILATTANRKTPAIENMLGCFINDIVLRSFVEGFQTGLTLLEQVKQIVSEGVANQDIPLQQVVKAVSSLKSVRTISVSMVPPMRWHSQILNCEIATVPLEHELWDAEHIPLELYIRSQGKDSQTIEVTGYYSTVFFTNQNIERLFSDYQEILQKLVEYPNTKLSEF
jgi:amino acid adenylation domain-containing protein